jgi:hypothetical protein
MTSSEYLPLSMREKRARPSHEALAEGVPPYLVYALRNWMQNQVAPSRFHRDGYGNPVKGPVVDNAFLDRVERNVRGRGFGQGSAKSRFDALQKIAELDGDEYLDAVDFVLHEHPDPAIDELETILREGGSAFRVGSAPDGRLCLERRVPEEIAAAIDSVIDESGRAGLHLRNAWSSVYARAPNPSDAYSEAVRAVEVAAIPVVSPSDATATLGKTIGALRADPQQWDLVLQPAKGESIDALLAMMDLLWTAQHDRHGKPDTEAPLNVSLEEAQAAVHLAVTLVQWFTSGSVRRT